MNMAMRAGFTEAIPMSRRRLCGAYLEEARSECLRYLRAPGFMLPILLFPAVFYLMFGVLMVHGHDSAGLARFMLSSYVAFGVMAPGLFGFGVSLAIERDGGLLTLKRAMPVPPGAYLLGKMLMAMLAAGLVVLLLLVLAIAMAGLSITLAQGLELLVTGMLGVLPFCALGMWVGTLIKGQGAPGLLNLVYLPMAFLSGLWVPLPALPEVLRRMAPFWPAYHLHQLTQAALGLRSGSIFTHAGVLLVFTAVFLLWAMWRLRRHG